MGHDLACSAFPAGAAVIFVPTEPFQVEPIQNHFFGKIAVKIEIGEIARMPETDALQKLNALVLALEMETIRILRQSAQAIDIILKPLTGPTLTRFRRLPRRVTLRVRFDLHCEAMPRLEK